MVGARYQSDESSSAKPLAAVPNQGEMQRLPMWMIDLFSNGQF